MHIEFLVEDQSSEAALRSVVPMILGPEVSFAIHPHQGKPDLLGKLPLILRGYRSWLPDDSRIVVLMDEDREDCRRLKARLEDMARQAGFVTRSEARGVPGFRVLIRLAVEELEAWFFGDFPALRSAYPRLDPRLQNRAPYRIPDAIKGGTWEALERELQRAGYFAGGLAKIMAAREISMHMHPDRNRSTSFQVFRQGLLALAN